jgi:uncharacterized 2Fe-2S/4Fe-4S cluster protein (DUF4445 family)
VLALMNKIKVTLLPEDREIWVPQGEMLSEALLMAGFALETPCAGHGVCGKCKVQVMGALAASTSASGESAGHLELYAAEWQHLSLEEIQQGYRLACQVVLQEDVQVRISSEFREVLRKTIDITSTGNGSKFPLCPLVRKAFLVLPEPTLEDRLGDWERMERGLVEKGFLPRPDQMERGLQLDGAVLQELPRVLRVNNYQVTAVLYDSKLIAVEAGDTTASSYGIALDIGTTTMVGGLIDLATGEQLAVTSRTNPQRSFGADVISRISFGSQGKSQLEELQSRLLEAVNQMIDELIETAQVDRKHIYEAVVVGNTAIHHLFLGLDPTYLGQGPYVPVVTRPLRVKARQLGIHLRDSSYLYLLPNIAGFVGGDAVGVILSTGLYQSSDIRLAVDIGTNGEIVLGSAQQLLACSTAAGPAFEGARIKHGMRAAEGAIEKVIMEEDVKVAVIGSVLPVGVSGSGLIDAVAEMLRLGIIDHTGRILSQAELPAELPESIRRRVVKDNNGREFILVWGEESGSSRPITINQEDIRELQLAKGAITAGIKVLQKELAIKKDQIAEVYLAGAFGSCINPVSAMAIGLIPAMPPGRVKAVGNAAGAGAKLALLSRSARKQAAGIAREVRYIELSGRPDFQEAFLNAMYFPNLRR